MDKSTRPKHNQEFKPMGRERETIQRREFLAMGIAATVAGASISCGRQSPSGWRFFTAEQARTVEAVCEHLIPGDQDPGAAEAGVACYIDLQLTKHFKRHQKDYLEGIAAVDAASRSRFQKTFLNLASAEQVEVLREIERSSSSFFDLILSHALQGFYGDPRHGGNRSEASWRMLGIPFPPVRGRANVDVGKR